MGRFPGMKIGLENKAEAEKYERIPEDAVFACAYLKFINPIDFGESAFFRRAGGSDQLWVASWEAEMSAVDYRTIEHGKQELFDSFSLSISAPSSGDEAQASRALLIHHFRSGVNSFSSGFPSDFIREGTLSEDQYLSIVKELNDELNETARQARERESSIVKTAGELGLNPNPTSDGAYSWRADCPGTGHPIWIDTEKDIFGCPWCKKKGDPEELIAFVRERRKK